MEKTTDLKDGIHGMLPSNEMSPPARKLRDFYEMKPNAAFFQREFGYYSLEKWIEDGYMKPYREVANYGKYMQDLFVFDDPGSLELGNAGWCEAAFHPVFEEKILEDLGDYELVQDFAGRHVLYFKGRRSGFMPEYKDHPVKDMKTWEENVKWRMDPNNEGRFDYLKELMPKAVDSAKKGCVITQRVAGGYMYLRSLIGPEGLLYMFYDNPGLVHECMSTWLMISDAVAAKHQEHVTFDELFFGEDICYNHGSLISPDMIREFLFPYYRQLIENIRRRQIDKGRKLHIQIDTDGFCDPVIDVYKEIGVDYFSPFEVASGSDVVRTGIEHPDLRILGGIDKRILASDKSEIDRMVDRIFPAMRKRGGYIPTCDHGVPAEVPFENYMHYRKRCLEFSK